MYGRYSPQTAAALNLDRLDILIRSRFPLLKEGCNFASHLAGNQAKFG